MTLDCWFWWYISVTQCITMPGNYVTVTAVWRHNVLTRKVMVAALTIDMFQTVISNRSYIHWSHNISVKSADKHDRFSTSPVKSQSHVLRYGLAWSSVKLIIWAPPSEFVSSSIPSWQISTAHAQPFRGATDLAFCLKVPLDSLLVWASSEGSGETARMRRLAWTFAARIGDK